MIEIETENRLLLRTRMAQLTALESRVRIRSKT